MRTTLPNFDGLDVTALDFAVDRHATDLKQIGNLVHGVEQLGGGTDGFHVAALRTGVGGHGRRIAMWGALASHRRHHPALRRKRRRRPLLAKLARNQW